MLQAVFKELYDQGILIFLNTDTYITNNTSDVDAETFADRASFLKMYGDTVERGWIFCHTKRIEDVVADLREDTCCMVEFGFNSDTEKKALDVGRCLYHCLTKFDYITRWDEAALKTRKLSTVIKLDSVPQGVRDLVNVDQDDSC
jgi:hypothetical protein